MNLIKVRMENNIALLNIDRPEALNALNRQVIDEIYERLWAEAGQPDVCGTVAVRRL